MPLLNLFPGSVTDVVKLHNLAEEARSIGIADCIFILDWALRSQGREGPISEMNPSITNAANDSMPKDKVYHLVDEELEIADTKLKGFVLFSKKKESDER